MQCMAWLLLGSQRGHGHQFWTGSTLMCLLSLVLMGVLRNSKMVSGRAFIRKLSVMFSDFIRTREILGAGREECLSF